MKRWQFWLGVVISVACMVFVIWQVDDWKAFGRSFLEANYWYMIPLTVSYFAIFFLRAIRWQYILNQCGHAGLKNVSIGILICYMGNNIFPLRAGEFMRVFLIGMKEESITYSAALATVVVERLFDFLTMLLFLAVVLIFIPFPEDYKGLEDLVHGFGAGTLVGALVLLVFLFLLYARSEAMISLIGRILFFLPERWKDPLLGILTRFSTGLNIMGKPRALVFVTVLSIVTWLVNLSPVWLTGLAFDIHISFMGCMFMLVVGSAAASIPATPGFFGTFHAFNQQGLVFLMGIDPGIALSFAIVLHATYYFPVILVGALVAWKEGYSLTRLKEQAEETEIQES